MAVHNAYDRHFISTGAVRTTGGSIDLPKGTFAIVDTDPRKTTKDGARVVDTFTKKGKYELRLGTADLPVTRTQSNKSKKSVVFSPGDIMDLQIGKPNKTEQTVDEVIIGYNGIDPETSMQFEIGSYREMIIELSGAQIARLGGGSVIKIPYQFHVDDCPVDNDCIDCDPCIKPNCTAIVEEAVAFLKDFEAAGGVKPFRDGLAEISVIRSCTEETPDVLVEYDTYSITVCDKGDEKSLLAIQNQYTGKKVLRTSSVDGISVYSITLPKEDGAPEDFIKKYNDALKGCDCPKGYDEVEGGEFYTVCLADAGADESATVEGIATAIAGTAVKLTGSKGIGVYSVCTTAVLTPAQEADFVTANPTAEVTYVGTKEAVCTKDPETFAWEYCFTCEATEHTYELTVPDEQCAGSITSTPRLEAIQAKYPQYTVTLVETQNCISKYEMKVPTNIVCDTCSPIFRDSFTSERPSAFETHSWVYVDETVQPTDDCLCGIKITGGTFNICPDECLRDHLGFEESSVRVRVTGGYVTEVREGIGAIEDKPFAVTYVSEASGRTGLGGNLWQFEDRSEYYFTGEARRFGDNKATVENALTGKQSVINACEQHVDFRIKVNRSYKAQSFSGSHEECFWYHIVVPYGAHKEVGELLNKLVVVGGNADPVAL